MKQILNMPDLYQKSAMLHSKYIQKRTRPPILYQSHMPGMLQCTEDLAVLKGAVGLAHSASAPQQPLLHPMCIITSP